jgi:hypothetical protein
LYRAKDFLEANKDAIEKAIYFRVADLLNLDVEILLVAGFRTDRIRPHDPGIADFGCGRLR